MLKSNKKQKGFSILAVILVIVAVVIAIGVWALSGKTNSSLKGSSSADILASSLINESNTIKLAFDKLVLEGANPNSIVFLPNTDSTPSAPNILDPTNGAQIPSPNKKLIMPGATVPNGIWVYQKTLTVPNVGTSAAEYAIVLGGVSDEVCKRINYSINGTSYIMTSATRSTSNLADVISANNPNSTLNVTLNVAVAGWPFGCVGHSFYPNENFFFRVLKAN